MVFHYLTFTFTFLFFETGSHSCSLDGCETCNAGEACFEPPALLLALPPAGYQAQSGSGTITRPPNREAVEVGIWRQAGSGIWVPQFWPVCLCDLVELALECHLQRWGMLSWLSRSHLCLGSSLESVFIHLALEVRGTSLPVILSNFRRREGTFGMLSTDSCSVAWTADLTYTSLILLSWSQCGKSLWSLGFIPTVMVQGYAVAGLYFEQCWGFVFWGVQSKQLICHLEKSGCNLKKEQIVTLGKKERPTREGNLSW